MPLSLPFRRNKVAASCDPTPPSASHEALIESFDHSGVRDKELIAALDVDKFKFSKMRAAVEGYPFPVRLLDRLPLHVRVDFHRRALLRDGYEVRAIDPQHLAQTIHEDLARLERALELYRRVGRAVHGGPDGR